MTLSDSWRKVGSGGTHCDAGNSNFNGNNWFRFVEPAGVKLSNTAIGGRACGTTISGWMSGSDPTIVGEILDRTACFHHVGFSCLWKVNLKVSLCSDNNNENFLIYQLENPPGCNAGYCAISN